MKMVNSEGEAVYLNSVMKHGELRWIVKAASGQYLIDRNKCKVKSRSFQNEAAANKFLMRYGYTDIV